MSDFSFLKHGNYKVVKKSNKLVNSRNGFSLYQQRIVLLMTTLIRDEDEHGEYRISIHDILGLDRKEKIPTGRYRHVKKAAEGLTESAIKIQEGKQWRSMSFITMAQGEYGKDYISVKFSLEMKPYFLNLREQFTTYFLHNVYSFKSAHSIRIYELLIQYYPNIRQRRLDVENLKDILEVQGRYRRFYDFKRRVIDTAVTEINAYSDIFVEYELIKSGRAVIEILFTMSENPKAKEQGLPMKEDMAKLLEHVRPAESVLDEETEDVEVLVLEESGQLPEEGVQALPQLVREGKMAEHLYLKLLEEHEQGFVDFTLEKVFKLEHVKNFSGYVLRAVLGAFYLEEYQNTISLRKSRSEALNTLKTNPSTTIGLAELRKEHNRVWKETMEKYLAGDVEDDLYEYFFENENHSAGIVKRYIQEWKEGNPTPAARYNFGSWLVRKYGTDEDKAAMELKSYAWLKHQVTID